MRILKVRIYLGNDFIVKVGSWGSNTYIIMDGEAAMYGINNELLGIMKSGSHFSNDLPSKMNNFEKKRLVHIMARTLTIVGVLKRSDILFLYEAFPEFKEKM